MYKCDICNFFTEDLEAMDKHEDEHQTNYRAIKEDEKKARKLEKKFAPGTAVRFSLNKSNMDYVMDVIMNDLLATLTNSLDDYYEEIREAALNTTYKVEELDLDPEYIDEATVGILSESFSFRISPSLFIFVSPNDLEVVK